MDKQTLEKEIDKMLRRIIYPHIRTFLKLEIFLAICGFCLAAIGSWTFRASRSFKQITQTKGNDISLLMEALRYMGNLYFIKCIFLVPITLLVIWIIIVAIYAFSGQPMVR